MSEENTETKQKAVPWTKLALGGLIAVAVIAAWMLRAYILWTLEAFVLLILAFAIAGLVLRVIDAKKSGRKLSSGDVTWNLKAAGCLLAIWFGLVMLGRVIVPADKGATDAEEMPVAAVIEETPETPEMPADAEEPEENASLRTAIANPAVEKARTACRVMGLDDVVIGERSGRYLVGATLESSEPAREAVVKFTTIVGVLAEFVDSGEAIFVGYRGHQRAAVLVCRIEDARAALADSQKWPSFLASVKMVNLGGMMLNDVKAVLERDFELSNTFLY